MLARALARRGGGRGADADRLRAVPGDRAAAGVRAGDGGRLGRAVRARLRDDAAGRRLPRRPVHARAGAGGVPARARRGGGGRDRAAGRDRLEVAGRCSPAFVLALQAAAALSVLAIGLAPGRPPRVEAARLARSDRGLADRRRRRARLAAARRARGRRRGRRDRLVPRALDGRAGAGRRLAWSRSTRTRAAIAGRRRSRPRRRAATPTTTPSTANLAAAGVADRVRHVRKFSADAHADVAGPLSLLYVDGAHRFGPARADLRDWGGRVAPGGTMLVHDAFSSIGVTLALLVECAGRARWRYVGRTG